MTAHAAHIAAIIRHQHQAVLEDVIAKHILWSPHRVSFTTRPGDDVVELNDGRSFLVRTAPVERDGALVYETSVTEL